MIKIYTKPNCPQCEMTKNFIIDNGIEAEFIDVTKDERALAYVKDLGYNAMPVVYVDKIHIGLGSVLMSRKSWWRNEII